MEERLNKQRRKKRKAKRKEIVLTPKQKYDQAIALKKAIRCMLKKKDQYLIYKKLSEDFAALAALPETEEFEGKEECSALSGECLAKAQELEAILPEEEEEDSRTVTTTAKELEQSGVIKKGKGKWIALAVLLAVIGIVAAFQIDGSRYVIAYIERVAGFKENARDMFQSVIPYNDSESQMAEVERTLLKEAKKGDEVPFGKAEWIVLAKKNGAVCIMENEGVKDLVFHEKEEAVNWETCSARQYLNSEFIEKNFTPSEQAMMRIVDVPADENKTYKSSPGQATQDRVYILSCKEIIKYKKILEEKANNIRLRTPGKENVATAYVSGMGEVVEYGYPVHKKGAKICPVMWITIE